MEGGEGRPLSLILNFCEVLASGVTRDFKGYNFQIWNPDLAFIFLKKLDNINM